MNRLKQPIILTNAAVKRLAELQKNNQFLKISTVKKGCSGLSYSLNYVNSINKLDEIVKQDGVTVIVDSKALFTLIGSEMDYKITPLSSQFTFNNPNAKGMCGCGQSFTV
jgi:iron-sulfur cluster assembly accessory protein